MNGEQNLQAYADRSFQKTMTKINDHVYHFLAYGHSSCIAIIANHSVILVDALDNIDYLQTVLDDLKKVTDKPVKTLIYTHGHPDHRGGSGILKGTVEEIIAHVPVKEGLKYYNRIADFCGKRGNYQFGVGLTDEEALCQGIGIREGYIVGKPKYQILPPTTLLTEEVTKRNIDGIEVEIVAAPGETDDTVFVYLPKDEILCCGDNYYGCFPNLYAIRGTQYRDVNQWVESLEKIISYHAAALLPGHTPVVLGKEKVEEVLTTYKDAIKYVFDKTLECMNQGMTIDETVQAVKLPEQYKTEYLEEHYGTVEWTVKSIYNGYVGWFDGKTSQLLPVPEKEYNDTLLELIGKDQLMNKVKECMDKEQYQLAMQLLDLCPDKELLSECYLQRAKQTENANARHYFLCARKDL